MEHHRNHLSWRFRIQAARGVFFNSCHRVCYPIVELCYPVHTNHYIWYSVLELYYSSPSISLWVIYLLKKLIILEYRLFNINIQVSWFKCKGINNLKSSCIESTLATLTSVIEFRGNRNYNYFIDNY